METLTTAVARLAQPDDTSQPAAGLVHYEKIEDKAVLARIEDFVSDPVLGPFLTKGYIPTMVSHLMGEPSVLFKEKVNFKYPGGGGFAPHQDAAAYRFADYHITCMVPLDECSTASGCLYVADGFACKLLPIAEGNSGIREDVNAAIAYHPVEMSVGDVMFFHSYVPHHSGTNLSKKPRRAIFLTYNALSYGDVRSEYYKNKRDEFAKSALGRHARLSIADDFLGKSVDEAY